MMKMLKWFNIEKGKHTTKNYTVLRWFVDEHANTRTYILPFKLVKMVVANKNYRLDLIHACVWDITTGETIAEGY